MPAASSKAYTHTHNNCSRSRERAEAEAGDSEQQGSSCNAAVIVLDLVSSDVASRVLETRAES